MYPYEGMFLLDPVAHTADPDAVASVVTTLLEKHGAKIHKNDTLEERRLAYEIKGHRRGIYQLVYFDMPGGSVDGMRKEARITELILRQLVIRLDWDVETYLAKSAVYYEKMREEQEGRRNERDDGDRRDSRDSRYEPRNTSVGDEEAASAG